MAKLAINGRVVTARAVIFDKDGTLIDFPYMWQAMARLRCELMLERLGVAPARAQTMRHTVMRAAGVDPETLAIHPRGPLAIAPRHEDMLAAATGLFLEGIPWDEAREVAAYAFSEADARRDLNALVRPVPGIPEALVNLKTAGVRVAIATTDMYRDTRQVMDILGITYLVDFVVASDHVTRNKPAPDMILRICGHFGIQPAEAVMVGDSVLDMLMAGNAGVGLKVAVPTGVTPRADLAPVADVVIDSLEEITVVKTGEAATPRRLEIYTDGASRGNPGPAGIGVLIRDASGLVAEIGEYIGETTNNAAEYHALIRALEEARRLEADSVEVYTDSELLVKQVKGEYQVKNPGLLPLYRKALALKTTFSAFRITHVPRGENSEADALANRGIDRQKHKNG